MLYSYTPPDHESPPTVNIETSSLEMDSRSQESVSGRTAIVDPQIEIHVTRAPEPSKSANARPSDLRQGATTSQHRGAGAVSGTSQPESRTAARVNAGERRGANLERTDSRQRRARSPSWSEEIDDVTDPASHVSANEDSVNPRSNEPGSSRAHAKTSLPSAETVQTVSDPALDHSTSSLIMEV